MYFNIPNIEQAYTASHVYMRMCIWIMYVSRICDNHLVNMWSGDPQSIFTFSLECDIAVPDSSIKVGVHVNMYSLWPRTYW